MLNNNNNHEEESSLDETITLGSSVEIHSNDTPCSTWDFVSDECGNSICGDVASLIHEVETEDKDQDESLKKVKKHEESQLNENKQKEEQDETKEDKKSDDYQFVTNDEKEDEDAVLNFDIDIDTLLMRPTINETVTSAIVPAAAQDNNLRSNWLWGHKYNVLLLLSFVLSSLLSLYLMWETTTWRTSYMLLVDEHQELQSSYWSLEQEMSDSIEDLKHQHSVAIRQRQQSMQRSMHGQQLVLKDEIQEQRSSKLRLQEEMQQQQKKHEDFIEKLKESHQDQRLRLNEEHEALVSTLKRGLERERQSFQSQAQRLMASNKELQEKMKEQEARFVQQEDLAQEYNASVTRLKLDLAREKQTFQSQLMQEQQVSNFQLEEETQKWQISYLLLEEEMQEVLLLIDEDEAQIEQLRDELQVQKEANVQLQRKSQEQKAYFEAEAQNLQSSYQLLEEEMQELLLQRSATDHNQRKSEDDRTQTKLEDDHSRQPFSPFCNWKTDDVTFSTFCVYDNDAETDAEAESDEKSSSFEWEEIFDVESENENELWSLVDNCWLEAAADVRLGACAKQTKENVRDLSASLWSNLEDMFGNNFAGSDSGTNKKKRDKNPNTPTQAQSSASDWLEDLLENTSEDLLEANTIAETILKDFAKDSQKLYETALKTASERIDEFTNYITETVKDVVEDNANHHSNDTNGDSKAALSKIIVEDTTNSSSSSIFNIKVPVTQAGNQSSRNRQDHADTLDHTKKSLVMETIDGVSAHLWKHLDKHTNINKKVNDHRFLISGIKENAKTNLKKASNGLHQIENAALSFMEKNLDVLSLLNLKQTAATNHKERFGSLAWYTKSKPLWEVLTAARPAAATVATRSTTAVALAAMPLAVNGVLSSLKIAAPALVPTAKPSTEMSGSSRTITGGLARPIGSGIVAAIESGAVIASAAALIGLGSNNTDINYPDIDDDDNEDNKIASLNHGEITNQLHSTTSTGTGNSSFLKQLNNNILLLPSPSYPSNTSTLQFK